jgi:3-phenylpropionate/trans-cinnamate dioxygenase ferredoxin subunit
MTDWVDVIEQTALAAGQHVVVEIDGTEVAVFNIAGNFYAIEDRCSHDGAEIASGELDGDAIICPRHGARFCVKTGQVLCAPAYEAIASFPVRIENDKIQVKDNRWD